MLGAKNLSNKHPQRKRTQEPPKKVSGVVKKPRVIKKPITCGSRNKTVCEKHEKPCAIHVDYPPNDDRLKWRAKLTEIGAPSHDSDSEHRCKHCMEERLQHSPHQNLEVEGLNAMQSARLTRESGRFIRRAE